MVRPSTLSRALDSKSPPGRTWSNDPGLDQVHSPSRSGCPRRLGLLEELSRCRGEPAPAIGVPPARAGRVGNCGIAALTGEPVAEAHVSQVPGGVGLSTEPRLDLAGSFRKLLPT